MFRKASAFAGLILHSFLVFAQSPGNASVYSFSQPTYNFSETNSLIKPIIHESTEIILKTESFISPDYRATQDKSFGFIGAHYLNLTKSDVLGPVSSSVHSDITAMVAPQNIVLSYINVSQIYTNVLGLTIGRKKNNWSLLDERWQLGLFQPQFRLNPLQPESQGLTGFFIDINNNDAISLVGLRLFGSFLYLPDQGASYSVKNGEFQSVNPWFPQMPSQVQYDASGNVINSIYWTIHQPDTMKVLFNSSYAAQFYIGDPSYKGFSAQASIAYKPANQFSIAADTATMAGPVTNVDIEPLMFFHALTAVDLHYNFSGFYIGTEALNEKPISIDSIPGTMSYRIFSEKQLFSSVVGYKGSDFEGSASVLKITGDSDNIVGPQSTYIKSYLPQRFSYGDAARADFNFNLPKILSSRIKAQLTVQTGLQNDYEMWTLGLKGRIKRNWLWNSQILLLRTTDVNIAQAGAPNLYQQFQNNDLLSFGVGYVF